ncbi:HesA/MoeB/ThiF family protein [Helicobacter aurati]|uniref:Molybdopterin-synthase adenylyltransferase n=1 Tax=Helicobacter aurati TaxID=137778 RepID=A0A3D8J309_9HELI|nr:HesA/MoeB/ThiF family protein [Helicobacter aurati]RDU71234.1 HesA/MoeB/ThiF family protein [Helicobacter aurati]
MESQELLQERYLRHLMLEDVGQEGQSKLAQSKVLVIGAGGLGSPVCLYLSAAGIGNIGIVDCDVVDISNLQRQVIHFTSDIGKSKISSASIKMRSINPNITVDTYFEKFTKNNASTIVQKYDFVVDATDNFTSKFLINDICVTANKPFSHAGVLKYRGQTMTVLPHKTACFRCVFENPPAKELDSIFTAGLFGVVPGIIGCLQASEVIKYILGLGELLTDTLLTIDIKTMNFRKVNVKKDAECSVCSQIST